MKKILQSLLFFSAFPIYAQITPPKLIVQIVVDQLRGDLIGQHIKQYGDGGFNYLLNHAIDFHNAYHPHANTTTCAGHATISTGSYPSLHGIVDNEWYDRKTHKMVYCMADPKSPVLPTIHTKKPIEGRSPHNLKTSTLSDEIMLAHRGRSFGVSLKDRAAITLGGHTGKAFWFDKTNGGFVSSTYYYSNYPQWVQAWNKDYKAKEYHWNLGQDKANYMNAKTPVFKHDYQSFGQTFPHHIVNPPSEEYYKWLSRTPLADQLTEDFAEQLIINEQLGKSEGQTDYLGLSFSAVDAIGHQFGPNSIESEDNLLELDKTLTKLLKAIDKQVGLDNTLIILTADHGVSDGPSFLKAHKFIQIKPIDTVVSEHFVRELLKNRFKLPPEALMSITPPYLYLDHDLLEKNLLNVAEVSRYVAEALNHQNGVFRAYPLPVSGVEPDWLSAKVNRMAYPYRSGDVYMVQPPYQSRPQDAEDRVAHGSPWRYDSYVPMLFVNARFKPQRIFREVHTTDIAPTLSALLSIKEPSAAVGIPLEEVLKAYSLPRN